MSRHRRPASSAARTAVRTAWVASAAAALAAGSLAGPAGPASALPKTQPVKQTTFFHCGSATTSKAGNTEGPATWDTTAPTASVSSGAGCGQLDMANTNVSAGPVNASTFRASGTFTGLLRDLTVRLDDIYVGEGRTTQGTQTLKVSLTIDGAARLKDASVRVQPKASSSGASESFTFSVADIGLVKDEVDEKAHTVVLTVEGSQTLNAWVYDTVEVPSGIVFNPDTLEAAPAVPDPV